MRIDWEGLHVLIGISSRLFRNKCPSDPRPKDPKLNWAGNTSLKKIIIKIKLPRYVNKKIIMFTRKKQKNPALPMEQPEIFFFFLGKKWNNLSWKCFVTRPKQQLKIVSNYGSQVEVPVEHLYNLQALTIGSMVKITPPHTSTVDQWPGSPSFGPHFLDLDSSLVICL